MRSAATPFSGQQSGEFLDGPRSLRCDGEPEPGREPHGAEAPQRVLPEPLGPVVVVTLSSPLSPPRPGAERQQRRIPRERSLLPPTQSSTVPEAGSHIRALTVKSRRRASRAAAA